MKKIKSLILFLLVSTLSFGANVQPVAKKDSAAKADSVKSLTNATKKSDLIWVRESDIPPSALANLQRDSKILDVEDKIEKIGEYVSIGREIGGAIDTSLSAIAWHADNISKTFVGKFTMLMIAWKVMGSDFKNKIVDVFVMITWVLFWLWSFRRNFSRRKMATKVQILPWSSWFKNFRRRKILETEWYDPTAKSNNVCDHCDKSCAVDDSHKHSYWVHIVVGPLLFIILLLITMFH